MSKTKSRISCSLKWVIHVYGDIYVWFCHISFIQIDALQKISAIYHLIFNEHKHTQTHTNTFIKFEVPTKLHGRVLCNIYYTRTAVKLTKITCRQLVLFWFKWKISHPENNDVCRKTLCNWCVSVNYVHIAWFDDLLWSN